MMTRNAKPKARSGFIGGAVLAGVIAWMLWPAAASGAGVVRINLAATSFRGLAASPHNDGLAGEPDACATQVALQDGDEHFGDRNNSTGTFEDGVVLPNGATVKSFSVYANDNDADQDIHAYLIRKLIANGTTPKEGGYSVMAQADGNGAANSVVRKFSAPTVTDPLVDNTKYVYYVELVICANTVEPFAVQIAANT